MAESEAQQRAAEALELDAKTITGNHWEAEPHCHTRKGCMCLSCDVVIGWQVCPGAALRMDQSCEMVTVDEETIDRCEEDVMDWNDANLIAAYRTICPELARDVQRLTDDLERITHGIHEVARDLYAAEVNQQSLGRTDYNAEKIRKAQHDLVALHEQKYDPRERWHSYISRLEKRLDEHGLLEPFREELREEAMAALKAEGYE